MTSTDTETQYPQEVISHPLVQEIETDPYPMLGMAPNVSYAAVKEHALQLLEDMWDRANESADDANPTDVYILALERLVSSMYVDLNYVIRMICPKNLETQLIDAANRFGGYSTGEKLLFNILFDLESSGVDYDYEERQQTLRTVTPFSAFRAEWDADVDQVITLYDKLPDHWKPAMDRFIERSVLYMYGPEPETN